MSASDSELPSEATISGKLRDTVIAIHKTGKPEDLTLKRVRARAEQELGLEAGFFKQNALWKDKSGTVINEAVGKYCGDEPSPEPSPKPAQAKPKPKPKPKTETEKAQGVKRKAAAPEKKPKKRKKASSEEESEAESSDAASEPTKAPVRRGRQVVPDDSDEEEDQAPKSTSKAKKPVSDEDSDGKPAPRANDDMSESEMSELIDDSPKKKSKQKKAPPAKMKKDKKAPAKAKAAPAKSKAADDDPNEAEIKRLQGWLVKCGIRKIWSRDPELSKCSTAKKKIQVLRSMLRDAGMDGKYSNEKAAAIKEQREFAKDLAAIQEGNQAWGNTGEVTTTGRPSRRAAAARPLPKQKVVLSDDSDEDMGSPSGDDGDDDDDNDDMDVDENEEEEGKDESSGDGASDSG